MASNVGLKISLNLPTKAEFQKQLDELLKNNKNSKLDLDIDTKAFTKSISDMSKELDKLKSKLGKFNVLDNIQLDDAKINRTTKEVNDLANAMGKLREKSELRVAKNDRTAELKQSQAINKALDDQYRASLRASEGTDKLGNSFKNTLANAGIFVSSAMIFNEVFQQIRSGIDEVIRLDSAMIDLKKVTDETDASYSKFLQGAHNTALEVGGQADQVVTATAQWAKAGKSLEESATLAKNTMIGVKVGDINVEDMQKYLVSPLKAYNMTAEESMRIIDTMNNVSNNHAITMVDLGEAYSKAASTMSMAGNSFEEFTAIVTGAQSATQLGGETIGHALGKLGA